MERLFEDDRRALEDLEKLLRGVVGTPRIRGVAGLGTINLETLLHGEGGFGKLDGLDFRRGEDALFVTTRGLLDAYLASHPRLPGELDALARTGAFYRSIFAWDVSVELIVELPVTPAGPTGAAKAYLAVGCQDVGPWLPSEIVVFATSGDRVFAVMSSLRDPLDRIPACDARWKEFETRYREAPPPGDGATADPARALDDGFEAYKQCFGRALPGQPSFAALTRRAQAIVAGLREEYPLLEWKGTCRAKGRFQDREYCRAEVMDLVAADGARAIPVLISQITDQRVVPEPVLDYWPRLRAGELALLVLDDLFLDASWQRRTMPELFPDRRCDPAIAAPACWARFRSKHSLTELQQRWSDFWKANAPRIHRDEGARCFRLDPAERGSVR